jgi:hypothetical protein
MTSSKRENRIAVSPTVLLVTSMICTVFCTGSPVHAQAQDAQPSKPGESYTATSQTSVDHTNPVRTTESHSRSGNRSVDKQWVEVLGPDGRYQPDSDTETETILVNATMTRTIVRTYRWDANGQRKLAQVTEEDARSSAGGDAHVVRTTSNSDVNGNLYLAQREIVDTKQTSPDEQETRTTVYLGDGNGGFTPSQQAHELQKRGVDNKVEVKKTMLLPGANGNWQVGEVNEKTISEDGKNRTTEERVSRPDIEGRLSEFSRAVGKQTETAAGEKSNTIETYTMDVPGIAGDGSLHLNERVTTVQNKDSDKKTTEQGVEQRNPANPSDGLQTSAKTKYTVRYAAAGTQRTTTMQTRDVNGNFNVVSVEAQKSDQPPPAQAPVPPSDTPQ